MVSILASVACLIALAYTALPWLIISIRGVAGLFSALSMIAASQWLLQHKGHHEGAPYSFQEWA
ncbi:Major facilitator superfamily MFS transporter [Pseudomonas syringae pv. syringae]|nr:Major facilitator superfamily MFS transporter [Pseudomonas syringae pv. syringae]